MRLLRTPIDEAEQHQAEASLHGGERHHGVLFVDEADDLLAVEQPPDIGARNRPAALDSKYNKR
jgi:hypothetical protein